MKRVCQKKWKKIGKSIPKTQLDGLHSNCEVLDNRKKKVGSPVAGIEYIVGNSII
jgi:hypothetical protein